MGPVTPYKLESIEGEIIARAKKIIEVSRLKAQQILKEASSEADRIRSTAREEGLATGVSEGKLKALQEERSRISEETAGIQEGLKNILSSLEQAKSAILNTYEKGLIKLALAIAQKVIKIGLDTQHERISLQNLKGALSLITQRTKVELHLNQQDLQMIQKYLPELQTQFHQIAQIELVADPSVSKGGCVVKTAEGEIDAQIETQVEEISREILGG